jgi:hypothetical protein
VLTKRFRIVSASVFGVSVLILLAGMLALPDNSAVEDQSTIHAIAVNVLAILVSIATPVCLLSAAGWVVAVILDTRRATDGDSILDWRLE